MLGETLRVKGQTTADTDIWRGHVRIQTVGGKEEWYTVSLLMLVFGQKNKYKLLSSYYFFKFTN